MTPEHRDVDLFPLPLLIMLKRAVFLISLAFLAPSFTACEGKKTAAQLTAEQDKVKKEERKKQAVKYYQELVDKYPDSEFAPKAKERLQAIGPVGSPAPKK